MRRDHRTDGPAVSSAISMTADIFINRAGIQTRTAADTIKPFADFRFYIQIGAAIVQQDHIHFFRSVCFPWLAWAAENSIVNGYILPGTVSSQQRPKKGEIINRRQYFFNTDD